MKNFSRRILSLSLIGAILLSACGKSSDTDTLSYSKEPGSTTTQASSTNTTLSNKESLIDPAAKEISDITAADFEQGISIDFAPYKGSFFDDNIISILSNNLQSVVEQNKDKFKENLNTKSVESTGEGFYFNNEGDQFMFYDLDVLEKLDQPDQIRVGVRFARKSSDGSITNTGITYFFTSNKEGEWGIGNID